MKKKEIEHIMKLSPLFEGRTKEDKKCLIKSVKIKFKNILRKKEVQDGKA